jgi:superoxide oxidase
MNTPNRYSAGQRRLHWLVFILVALAYAAMEFRGEFERGTLARTLMVQSHFWIGITVLVLVVPRLWLRFKRGVPAITPALPGWQSAIGGLMHWLLYAFLLVQPVMGLMTAWTDGKQVMLPFGGLVLPSLMAPNAELAHTLEDLHGTIGEAFYWIIGFHIVAAIYHHFVRKDDTLRRMG